MTTWCAYAIRFLSDGIPFDDKEPISNFTLENAVSNQALIIASEENLEAKRDFLKKIGSNPRLASRSLLFDFKNPWRILAETPVASLCDAPNFGEKTNSETWLGYKDSNLD